MEQFAFLMLEAKLTLEPQSIRTQALGAVPVPKLAGSSEIAEILGVTKARVSQLARSEGFPAPIARLSMGPVYMERAIRDFKQSREAAVQRREVAKFRLASVNLRAQ
jgi:transcriptional regulator with XRE-family HTH domain